MTETLYVTIDRGEHQMATSFLVWGKFRAYPQTDGDGVFVGEVEIAPEDASVTTSWTSPNNSTDWKFIAAPKFNELVGVFGQLDTP